MPKFIGRLRKFMLWVLMATAVFCTATRALSQTTRMNETERKINTIRQQMEDVEHKFAAVRIEIMKLRADADYIESAISEEMHVMQALRPEDQLSPAPRDSAQDSTLKTESVPRSPRSAEWAPAENPSVASTQPAQSPASGNVPKEQELVTVKRRANIRATPSLQGRILGAADAGMRFVLLNRTPGWVEIEREGSSAWIAHQFLGSGPSSTVGNKPRSTVVTR